MYYIGYTKDASTIVKIASYNASGLSATFAISGGYITMSIANPTGASRSYMSSVFY